MKVRTLGKISYGLYVMNSKEGAPLNGQITNKVFQLTAESPCIGISINKKNFTDECIRESNIFSVSILSIKTSMKFLEPFGYQYGRTSDKCRDIDFKIGTTGAPIVFDYVIEYINRIPTINQINQTNARRRSL